MSLFNSKNFLFTCHTTGAPGSDLTDTMQKDMSTMTTQLSTASSTEAQHLSKSGKSQGTVVPCI